MTRRLSAQATAVLRTLAADPRRWRYGYELGREVGLKTGSLYPILIRLHDRGLLESAWETEPPDGRPPRHLYRLSGEGVRVAAEPTQVAVSEPAAAETGPVTRGAVRRPLLRPTRRSAPGAAS